MSAVKRLLENRRGRLRLLAMAVILVVGCGQREASPNKRPDPQSSTMDPGRTAPSTSAPAPSKARRICVIDNSADMVGDDGVHIDGDGSAPIFTYLLTQLQCTDCIGWSAFDASREGSTVFGACDRFSLSPGTLTMTSPLATTLRRFMARPDQLHDVYFITNGLDWETRGEDAAYRVEMNMGRDICDWMSKRTESAVVIGAARDGSGGHQRRPLAVYGFGHGGTMQPFGDDSNTPSIFAFASTIVRNPSNVVRNGAVDIQPSASVTTRSQTEDVLVAPGGNVQIRTHDVQDVTLKVSNRLSPHMALGAAVRWLVSIDGGAFVPVASSITTDGSYECIIHFPDVPAGGRVFHVRFGIAPGLPIELTKLVGSEHSVSRTFETLAAQCTQYPLIRVARSGASTVPALTVDIAPAEGR
jgi:hypothetical protein